MSDERTELWARGEEFLQLMGRGLEFTRELLRENERLRKRLVELEDEQLTSAQSPADWEKLEEESNRLANLYVAINQLHSTLEVDEVLRITIEIAINLIGAETFAIYLLDEGRQELRAVAAQGIALSQLPACRMDEGRLGASASERAIRTFDAEADRGPDPERPLVCIPLCVQGRAIGAIAILGLLPQKRGFSALDREVFEVLAGHAATAILAARLHSQSERKLNTIQGLIDLLAR